MDTITHGIAGALIAKAVFRGEDLFSSQSKRPASPTEPGQAEGGPYVTRGRIVTWSLMLGAIFPDSDVIRDIFSHDKLLMITWHRSITHSLLLLPLWTVLLAAITRPFANWRKWQTPSFATLSLVYGLGILSHILLDLVTSFGTMIWSPLEWSRPAWDLIFILDFTLSAIVLVPQFLAWAYSQPEKMRRRVIGLWLVLAPIPLIIARLGETVGAPISDRVVLMIVVVLSVIIVLPARRGWGLKIQYANWNRAGLAATLIYVALTFFAHRSALARINKFAELYHLQAQSIGALPLPPSLWDWDGLIRTERGVYELRMDVSHKPASDSELLSQEHRYYPDAPPNSYIEAAKRLPEVQKVLWFARFPVTQFHKEGDEAIVEISDARFPRMRSGRPPSFMYRVRFGAEGNVVSQGWVTR